MASAFFYGTLMHPKILKRVIGHEGSYLEISPALLLDYTRHKINGADYPGIVPYDRSRVLFSEDLDLKERCVRGSLVTGLSAGDVRLLDIFEGDEYMRERVVVHPLGAAVGLDDVEVSGDPPPVPARDMLGDGVEVETYVWCEPVTRLGSNLWTFASFVNECSHKWIGEASREKSDYTEVDRRRAMEGNIVRGSEGIYI